MHYSESSIFSVTAAVAVPEPVFSSPSFLPFYSSSLYSSSCSYSVLVYVPVLVSVSVSFPSSSDFSLMHLVLSYLVAAKPVAHLGVAVFQLHLNPEEQAQKPTDTSF